MRHLCLLAFAILIVAASCKVHFEETFDKSWENRWVKSTSKEKEGSQGKFTWTETQWPLSSGEKGLFTSEDSRFYGISAPFHKFSNRGKNLVLQYVVKFTQKIDCGGGYLKVGPSPAPGAGFHGETPYNIMFGPDFCGSSTKKVHVIFSYQGKNHLIKKSITPKDDQLSHLYTLIVTPDNKYQVLIDGTEAAAGKLTDDWDFLPAKEIKDPKQSKPSDWVDDAEIDDPTDHKPAGYDDLPKQIRDPEAQKPEDWDDALDGEWEAPMIDNPEYKGEWKAKRIPNPAYKGAWVHPMVPNPDYKEDDAIYAYDDFSWVGIDIWQVKSGTLFDSIYIGDDAEAAKEWGKKHFEDLKDGEKKRFDEHEEKRKAEEEAARKKAEAETKKDGASAGADHGHDDDDDGKDEL